MAKKRYISPVLMSLTPDDDPTIVFGGSQGTSGDDSQFSWDKEIDSNDIEMFWNSYDETELAAIDTDGNLYISKDEFTAWYNANEPW